MMAVRSYDCGASCLPAVSSWVHSFPCDDQDHVVAAHNLPPSLPPSLHGGCRRSAPLLSSPLRKNSKGPGNLFIRKSCGSLSCLAEALTSPILSCILLPRDIFSCSLAHLGESQICKSRPQKAWQSVLGVYWKGKEADDQNTGRGMSLGHSRECVLKVRTEASPPLPNHLEIK